MTDYSALVAQAIRESVQTDRSVRLEVADLETALAEVSAQTDECDSATEQDGSLDVWGTTEDGGAYRLTLRTA